MADETIIIASGETVSGARYYSGEHIVVRSGGTLQDSELTHKASGLTLEGGAILSGTITTAASVTVNGKVTADQANLVFDISERKKEEGLLWSDLSLTQAKSITVNVSPNQNKGTYRLAGNADDFTGTLTVTNTSGTELGQLSLENSELVYDITRYTLATNEYGELTLTVSSNITDDSKYVFLYKNNQLVLPLKEVYDVTVSGSGEYDHLVIIEDGLAGNVLLENSGVVTVYAGGTAAGIDQRDGGKLRFDYTEGDTTLITGVNPYGTFMVQGDYLQNVYGENVTLSGALTVEDYHSNGVFTSRNGVDISGVFVSGNSSNFEYGTTIHDSELSGNNMYFQSGITVTDSTISYGNFYGGDYTNVTIGGGYFYGGTYGKTTLNGTGYLYRYIALDDTLTVNGNFVMWGGYIDAAGNTIILNYRNRGTGTDAVMDGNYVSEDAVFRIDLLKDQSVGTYQLLGNGRSKFSFTIHTDEGDLGTITETNKTFEYGNYTYTINTGAELEIGISENADETFNVLYWGADGTFYHSEEVYSVTVSSSEYKEMQVRENGFVGDIHLASGGLLDIAVSGIAIGIDHKDNAALRFNYTAGDYTLITGVNQYGTFMVQGDLLMNVVGENVTLNGELSVQDYHSTGVFSAEGEVAFSGIFYSGGKSAVFEAGTSFRNAEISGNNIEFKGTTVSDSTISSATFRSGTFTNVTVGGGYYRGGTFGNAEWKGGTVWGNVELSGTLTVTGDIGYWGGCIRANGNLIILDYTNRTVKNGAILRTDSVSENVVFQIKLKDDQAVGTYSILSNAGSFVDTFNVTIGENKIGTFDRDHTYFEYGNYTYEMSWDVLTQNIKLTIGISENASSEFSVICYDTEGNITYAPEMSSITVDGTNCAEVIVRHDGILENMKLNSGVATVRQGGTVYGLEQSGGRLRFDYAEGDSTFITGVNQYGTFFVYDNELINVSGENVNVTGAVRVEDYHSNGNFTAEGADITGYFYGNGTFTGGTIKNAQITGTATVNGEAEVRESTFGGASFNGGSYESVTVTGSASLSGGEYGDVTLAGGGQITGKITLTDRLVIAKTVNCYKGYYANGAIDANGEEVNLDLTGRSNIDGALINLDRVYNADLTLTVYADQTIGEYSLGSDAGTIGQGDNKGYWDIDTNTWYYKGAVQGDLDGIITVRSSDGIKLAECTVNGDTEYFGRYNYRVYTDENNILKLFIGWNNREDLVFTPDGLNNDTMATATDLPSDGTKYTIDSTEDTDWFKFTLETAGQKSSYMGIDFKQWAGDLELYLYDNNGNLLDYATSVTDNEIISLQGLAAGTYYIQVAGDEGNTNEYTFNYQLPEKQVLTDEYEKGNTSLTNTYLGGISGEKTIHGAIQTANDVDYYSFGLSRKGTTADSVTLKFDTEYGDLDLYLYDVNGIFLLGKSVSTESSEETISLKGLNRGIYVVKVVSKDGTTVANYDLTFNVREDTVDPDKYENNNTLKKAKNLYALNGKDQNKNLSIHDDNDVDYFKFTLKETGSDDDYIRIDYESNLGDIDIDILDKSGKVVAGSHTAENYDQVSLKGLAEGDYYIKVYGYNGVANYYDMSWNITNSQLIPSDTYEGNGPITIREDQTITGLSIAKVRKKDETREDVFKITLEYDAWKRSKIILSDYRSDWEEGMAYVLKDAAGNILQQGTGSEISLAGYKKGDYYLTVDTPNENEYSTYNVTAQSLPDSDADVQNNWTLFVYLAGDNNLEGSYLTELLYMQRAILPEDVEVYVLMDRAEDYSSNQRDWTDTRVGRIRHSEGGAVAVEWMYFDGTNTSTYMTTRNLDQQKEWDTGDVKTLEAFLDWGMQTAPAEHYALIMKDHGTSLGYNSSDVESGSIMSITDIADLLSDKKYDRVEVTAFDQCLMGSDVVITTMEGNVDYVVASEAVGYTPNQLMMYKVLFNSLTTDMTAQELAQKMVKACNCSGLLDLTLASFNTQDSTLSEALNAFAEASSGFTRADWVTLCRSFALAYNYGDEICAYSDLGMLLNTIKSYSTTISGNLLSATEALYDVVLNSVIDSTMITPATYGTGLAVYNPVLSDDMMNLYSYGEDSSLDYYATSIGKMSWGNMLYTVGKLADDCSEYFVDASAGLTFTDYTYSFEDDQIQTTYNLGAFAGNGVEYNGLYLDKKVYFTITLDKAGIEGDAIRVTADNPDANITLTLIQQGIVQTVRRTSEDGVLSLAGIDCENAEVLSEYILVITSDEETTYNLSMEANWTSGSDYFDYSRSGNQLGKQGNGSVEKATALATGNYGGLVTYAGDADYYQLNTVYADSLDVIVTGEGLTVRELGTNGNILETATQSGKEYSIKIASGNYLFVEGNADIAQNQVNSYSMKISDMAQTYLKAELTATAPEKPILSQEYKGDYVVVTPEAEEGIEVYYSSDLLNWTSVTDSVALTKDGDYYFKAYDPETKISSSYTSTHVEIEKVEGVITITANSKSKVYDGSALTDSGFTWTDGILKDGDVLSATVEGTLTDAGSAENVVKNYKVMRGDIDVTAIYTFADSVNGTLTVTKKNITVTANDLSKTYGAKDPLLTYTADLVNDDKLEGSLSRVEGEELGTYVISQGTLSGGRNYNITGFTEGTFTIVPKTAEINADDPTNTGNDAYITYNITEQMYDGSTSIDEASLTLHIDGKEIALKFTDAQFNTANVSVSNATFTGLTSTDKNYKLSTDSITLDAANKITKRQVTITSGSDTKEYDGSALTKHTVTVSGDGFIEGEGVGYIYSGSQTAIGSSKNAFEYTLNNGTLAENYTIKTVEGDLTVTKPVITIKAEADITELTNKDVTVTATFSKNSALNEYSLNGSEWLEYKNAIVFEENGTVYFRGTDAGGNISEITSYTVANIDKIAPDKPVASADITERTSKNVTVSAAFSEDSVKKEYSLDSKKWNTYTAGIVFTENGGIYFRGTDAAGNVSEVTSYTVSNIYSDDWTDLKTKGKDGQVGSFGEFSVGATYTDEIGKDDLVDYLEFTLDDAAKVSFTVNSVNAAKFTINSLQSKTSKGITTYSLKSLQSTTVKAGKDANTSALLLEAGTYYIGMAATDKKSADAEYTITVNENTVIFDKGDNSDDWTDMKTSGAEGLEASVGTISESGELVSDGWVGYGDAVDYMAFNLDSGANLMFDLNVSDAAKFTVYSLQSKTDKKGNTTYSLKSLQSTTLKKGDSTTKNLLLSAGDYYICMQSTNAAKGGSVGYAIAVNEKSEFYTQADKGTNNWLYDSKTKVLNDDLKEIASVEPGENVDIDSTTTNWVGYGDDTDYAKITLTNAGKISFNVTASDAAKITLYQATAVTNKSGVITGYKVKSLQSTTLKLDKTSGEYKTTTADKLLTAGEYYICMQSTNATKGGSAEYTVQLSEKSEFYQVDTANDDWKATDQTLAMDDSVTGWVGFSDAKDYYEFTTDETGFVKFDLSGVSNNAKMTVYEKVSDTKVKSLKSVTATAKKAATSGDLILKSETTYYVCAEATGAASGKNTDYTLTATNRGTFNMANNSFEDATIVSESYSGVLTKTSGGDKIDYLDVADLSSMTMEMTSGSVKLSFLDENKKAVKVSVTDSREKTKAYSSITLKDGDKSFDTISCADLASVKYLKLEAGASGLCSYTLA